MTDNELVPRTVPIVGMTDEVARALATQAQAGRLLTHPDRISIRNLPDGRIEIRPTLLVQVARRKPAPAPVRRDDTFASIMKALAFVAVLFTLAGVAVWAIIAAIGATTILGGLAVAVLICIGLANRTRHSGICPGVVVHCAGCKH